MRKLLVVLALLTMFAAMPQAGADPVTDEAAYLAATGDTLGSSALGFVSTDQVTQQVGDEAALAGAAQGAAQQVLDHAAFLASQTAAQATGTALPASGNVVDAAKAAVAQGPRGVTNAVGQVVDSQTQQVGAAGQLVASLGQDQVLTAEELVAMHGCDVGTVHVAGSMLPFPGTWQGAMAICATLEGPFG